MGRVHPGFLRILGGKILNNPPITASRALAGSPVKLSSRWSRFSVSRGRKTPSETGVEGFQAVRVRYKVRAFVFMTFDGSSPPPSVGGERGGLTAQEASSNTAGAMGFQAAAS